MLVNTNQSSLLASYIQRQQTAQSATVQQTQSTPSAIVPQKLDTETIQSNSKNPKEILTKAKNFVSKNKKVILGTLAGIAAVAISAYAIIRHRKAAATPPPPPIEVSEDTREALGELIDVFDILGK